MNQLIDMLHSMKSDTIENYVVAGLDSHLLNNGRVRLFECSRDHQDQLTPHNHRFNFACLVLAGSVTNRVWSKCCKGDGDNFMTSILTYKGNVGEHTVSREGTGHWRYEDTVYSVGDTYYMTSSEVHSIQFSRGAKVLFLEGPTLRNSSIIIEPFVNGQVIPTYSRKPYMFKGLSSMPPAFTTAS